MSGYSHVYPWDAHVQKFLFSKTKLKKRPSLHIFKQNSYTPISLKCSFLFMFENQLYGNVSNSFLFKVPSMCLWDTKSSYGTHNHVNKQGQSLVISVIICRGTSWLFLEESRKSSKKKDYLSWILQDKQEFSSHRDGIEDFRWESMTWSGTGRRLWGKGAGTEVVLVGWVRLQSPVCHLDSILRAKRSQNHCYLQSHSLLLTTLQVFSKVNRDKKKSGSLQNNMRILIGKENHTMRKNRLCLCQKKNP